MHNSRRHSALPLGATATVQAEGTRKQSRNSPTWVMLAVFALAIALALFASACATTTASSTSATTPAATAPGELFSSVAIGVLLDKTESAPEYGVPAPKPDAFAPLIKVVRQNGGDFRAEEITGRSPDAMVRLHVAPPPACPPAPLADTTGNAFIDQELVESYETRKGAYDEAYSRWRATADGDTARFQQDLQRLLAKPAIAKHTDIFDALNRAMCFLGEPQAPGQVLVHRYLLLLTDGRDNVHAAPVTVPSDIRVLVVNGSGSLGALQSLRPLRFESLAAAIDFVVKTESMAKE